MPSLDSYYQPDFSHKKNKPRSTPSTAPQYSIGLDGVPVRANSNPVRPSQAGGEPTAYAQHSGTTYYQLPDGRDVYQTSGGATYDRASGQQVGISTTTGESGVHDGAFSARPGGFNAYKGTNLRNEDNQVIEKGTQVWKVPDSTLNTGGGGGNRDNSRVVPGSGGMVQKGTDMRRSFNDLLAATNTSGYQPFGSNQLPTTAGSPDSKVTPKTDPAYTTIQPDNPVFAEAFGQDLADKYKKGPSYTAIQPDSPQFAEAFGQDLADKYKSAADSKVTGYTKGGRLDQALSDKEGINSYMSKFSSGDQERLANRAFLDTEGSMAGLRAKEAVNGVVYAGGQHYVAGKSGDDKAVAIDRSAARDISNGNETSAGASQKAQDFLAKKTADTVAATKQAPTVLEDGAKDGAFKQDKPMFSGSTPAIGGAVEFDNNNDKTLPTFGNNGGYKSGFKKIDTTMTNPFG